MTCWQTIPSNLNHCCRCDRYIDDWKSCYTCGQKFCFPCIYSFDFEKTTHFVKGHEYCSKHLPLTKEEKADFRADFFSKVNIYK